MKLEKVDLLKCIQNRTGAAYLGGCDFDGVLICDDLGAITLSVLRWADASTRSYP